MKASIGYLLERFELPPASFDRMKSSLSACLVILALHTGVHAEPVAEGSYVDLIVVPIGPVALAEFEADAPPAAPEKDAAKAGADPGNEKAPPAGGGSGIRVKQQNPDEIAPASVFIKLGSSKFFQIPCSQNSITSPIRTPIADSEITLLVREGDGGTSFTELGKIKVTRPGERILVLLSKPFTEKKWNKPTVSFFPMPAKAQPQLMFVNGSEELRCGVKVADGGKALDPLKQLIWESPVSSSTGVDVSLAMCTRKGEFLPPFYQSNVELNANTVSLFIPYGVSTVESFRGGKFATGIVENGITRAATPYNTGK